MGCLPSFTEVEAGTTTCSFVGTTFDTTGTEVVGALESGVPLSGVLAAVGAPAPAIETNCLAIQRVAPTGGSMRRNPSGLLPRILTSAPLFSIAWTVYLLSLSSDPARTRTLFPLTTPLLSARST